MADKNEYLRTYFFEQKVYLIYINKQCLAIYIRMQRFHANFTDNLYTSKILYSIYSKMSNNPVL